MKETTQPTHMQIDTTERLYDVLGFDTKDFQASAAAMYLLGSDDIVSARQNASSKLVEAWVLSDETSYNPSPAELKTAAVNVAASAAVETSSILPHQTEEAEYFWYEIGTAITGAEIEVFSNGKKGESIPLTSDGLFHNALSDRNRFRRMYTEAIDSIRSQQTLMHEDVPVALIQPPETPFT